MAGTFVVRAAMSWLAVVVASTGSVSAGTLQLDFSAPVPGTITDKNGSGTGLTDRLPGTGGDLDPDDTRLDLDVADGVLRVTSSNADLNGQINLSAQEALGIRLSRLGFTGGEDFSISARMLSLQYDNNFDQLGLYVGAAGDRLFRGGVIFSGLHVIFSEHTIGGLGASFLDEYSPRLPEARDVQMTLTRKGGVYRLLVQNLDPSGRLFEVPLVQPPHLDGEADLFVGVFASNAGNDTPIAMTVDDFRVVVGGDCNSNRVIDEDDIATGTSDDEDRNGVPDECDRAVCHSHWVAPPAAGLVAHWKLDEAPGSQVLDSAGAGHGLNLGCLAGLSGVSGTAYHFNGTNNGLVLDDTLGDFGAGDFTIAAFVKCAAGHGSDPWPNGGTIFSHLTTFGWWTAPEGTPGAKYLRAWGWVTLVITDGKPWFFLRDERDLCPSVPVVECSYKLELLGPRRLNDGEWHHVVAVREGTSAFLYVDGNLAAAGSNPDLGNVTGEYRGHPPSNRYIRIGSTRGAGDHLTAPLIEGMLYQGFLDEITVHNRALRPEEIRDSDCDGLRDSFDYSCTDSDGDGLADPDSAFNACPLDNCPGIYNPRQEDANFDGVGDACECGFGALVREFAGEAPGDLFGYSIAGGADVDGDGTPDLIAGAFSSDAGGADAGRVSVISAQSVVRTFTGAAPGDGFGVSVATADVDGDGHADVLVGAYLSDLGGQSSGAAYLFSGRTSEILHLFVGAAPGDRFGLSVAAAGDVDRDGTPDVAVGSPHKVPAGRAYLFSGRTFEEIRSFGGESPGDFFGYAVDGAGDVDGDGYADLIVGAYGHDAAGVDAGRATVYSGRDGALLHTFTGEAARDHFGESVSGAGDVDRDGHADLVVGAPLNDAKGDATGRAYVYSGRSGRRLLVLSGGAAGDTFGQAVAEAGDVDRDGSPDVLVGAPKSDPRERNAGSVSVHSGLTGGLLLRLSGTEEGEAFGSAVVAAGDVDRDGVGDIAAGSSLSDRGGEDSGSASVVFLGDGDGDGLIDVCDRFLSTPSLSFGAPIDLALTPDAPAATFKLNPPPGKVIVLSIEDADALDENAIYFRWNGPAGPEGFDFVGDLPDQSSQRVIVPETRREVGIVTVRANSISGSSNALRLLARLEELIVDPLEETRRVGAEASDVTVTLRGGGFGASTVFSLEHRTRPEPSAVRGVIDQSILGGGRADLTFDMGVPGSEERAPLGEYDLVVIKSPAVVRLERAVTVVSDRFGANLQVELAAPEFCRYNRQALLRVHYTNAGQAELRAPLLKILASKSDGTPLDGTSFRIEGQERAGGNGFQLLGFHPHGAAGTLPPGASGEVPILFQTTGCLTCEIRLQVFALTPNQGSNLDWAQIPPPQGVMQEDWSKASVPLSLSLGTRWVEYHEGLAARATRLARRGVHPASVVDIFRFAVREAFGRPSAAVVGRVVDGSSGIPLPEKIVLASQGSVVRSWTTTDLAGSFALDWLLSNAAYRIGVLGSEVVGGGEIDVPAASDVVGVEFSVTAVGTDLRVPACSACDASGLPESVPVPPDGLFTLVAERRIEAVSAWDPNEKQGPTGEGDQGLVDGKAALEYTIFFENLPSACDAVQDVEVIDPLDDDLDVSSFQFLDVKLAGQVANPCVQTFVGFNPSASGGPLHQVAFSQECRVIHQSVEEPCRGLPYERDVRVEITGEIVSLPGFGTEHQALWTFTTVRGAEDVETGFLVPNKANSQGEGSVTFSIKPRSDLADGTIIENLGWVTFDELPPFEVSRDLDGDGKSDGVPWRNTIGTVTETVFLRGDSNHSGGDLDISDGIFTFSYLFLGGAEPACLKAADTNDDGELDLSDGISLLSFLFTAGSSPPAPSGPGCGVDPTKDPLTCLSAAACAK